MFHKTLRLQVTADVLLIQEQKGRGMRYVPVTLPTRG